MSRAGKQIIDAAKEAVAIAKGEQPAALEKIAELERELRDWRDGDLRGVQAHMEAFRLRAEAAEARLAEAEKVLEPFVAAFERRRDRYSRRHQDRELGFANFDKMPDEWPMEKLVFNMGAFRRARAFLAGEQKP